MELKLQSKGKRKYITVMKKTNWNNMKVQKKWKP